jgi:hypothetical protein
MVLADTMISMYVTDRRLGNAVPLLGSVGRTCTIAPTFLAVNLNTEPAIPRRQFLRLQLQVAVQRPQLRRQPLPLRQ